MGAPCHVFPEQLTEEVEPGEEQVWGATAQSVVE